MAGFKRNVIPYCTAYGGSVVVSDESGALHITGGPFLPGQATNGASSPDGEQIVFAGTTDEYHYKNYLAYSVDHGASWEFVFFETRSQDVMGVVWGKNCFFVSLGTMNNYDYKIYRLRLLEQPVVLEPMLFHGRHDGWLLSSNPAGDVVFLEHLAADYSGDLIYTRDDGDTWKRAPSYWRYAFPSLPIWDERIGKFLILVGDEYWISGGPDYGTHYAFEMWELDLDKGTLKFLDRINRLDGKRLNWAQSIVYPGWYEQEGIISSPYWHSANSLYFTVAAGAIGNVDPAFAKWDPSSTTLSLPSYTYYPIGEPALHTVRAFYEDGFCAKFIPRGSYGLQSHEYLALCSIVGSPLRYNEVVPVDVVGGSGKIINNKPLKIVTDGALGGGGWKVGHLVL